MKPSHPPRLLTAFMLLAITAATGPAFEAGHPAYTKRVETVLLAEPQALAETVGKVGYAEELQVEEVRGGWLRVSHGESAGWVFAGNVAGARPAAPKGLDGVPLLASKTTATAAARPLTEAAAAYAARRKLVNAPADLDWITAAAARVTPADVDNFLREQKKGEYQ